MSSYTSTVFHAPHAEGGASEISQGSELGLVFSKEGGANGKNKELKSQYLYILPNFYSILTERKEQIINPKSYENVEMNPHLVSQTEGVWKLVRFAAY